MRKDIDNRDDVKVLIDSFYEKVRTDEAIGYIFNDVARVDWAHHLPVMYDFWEGILFGTGPYRGDPMTKHVQLNKQTPLKAVHFEQWKQLFFDTVDQHFEGAMADEAKERATTIARLMEHKIHNSKR